MLGTDIALRHLVAEERFRDYLSEAERRHAENLALEARPRRPRAAMFEARATVASLLLRAGSWLMPEEAPDAGNRPVAFELRTGQ